MGILDKGAEPTYLMGSLWPAVEMVEKERQVFNASTNSMQTIAFTRTNVQDTYNHLMNGVDVADQLRDAYPLDRPWVRTRKWWFAVWMWAVGVAITNAYLIYKAKHADAQERAKQQDGNYRPVKSMSHRQFIEELCRDLDYWGSRGRKRRSSEGSQASQGSTCSTESGGKKKRGRYLTKATMAATRHQRGRNHGEHTFDVVASRGIQCQYCRYRQREHLQTNCSKAALKCRGCDVHLCLTCWGPFHMLDDGDEADDEAESSEDDE